MVRLWGKRGVGGVAGVALRAGNGMCVYAMI